MSFFLVSMDMCASRILVIIHTQVPLVTHMCFYIMYLYLRMELLSVYLKVQYYKKVVD